MAVKTKRISTLIESQLPEFISSEYELFSKFVQKYYEAQEVQGGPLDILSNIQKYTDIDYYEQNLLKQNDILAASISATDTDIVLQDASSFPEKNGYVKIGDEIIFYATRTNTTLQECSRGVSGNTTLGDLYSSSDFQSTDAAFHVAGSTVHNVSNLFLYAFVKNFESQYLGSFPEKYLKGDVDKRTLIKNIQKFYKAKGTDSSIKFIFNTIVSKDLSNKPSVYKPRDFTYKASESDWISVYALKVKVISGDPRSLIGKVVVQNPSDEYGYASATVDNVFPDGTLDDEVIWNIAFAPETVNGFFAISTKTRLEKELLSTDGEGKRVNVFSTVGWDRTGEVLIGEEVIKFDDKNVSQFIIKNRGQIPVTHSVGSSVYKPVVISGSGVSLITLGVVYNLSPEEAVPYSSVGDRIQVSNPGFETSDPKIVKTGTNQPRWILGQGLPVDAPTNPTVENALDGVSTNVSAIHADDQYYYISSSSYPSYRILDGSNVTETVRDQKILRLIRKEATRTTEVYKTPRRDVGILLNGVPIYGYKDDESVFFGRLERIQVNTQGRGYSKPPFVLVDGVPNRARAVLSGQVVERIIVDTRTIFPRTPRIEITSGRNAEVRAIVTGGSVTSLVIDNPGEFYSSSPIVRITDTAGRGRFAEYNAIVDTDGKITGFDKIDGGTLYNQNTVVVDIIPVGSGATGTPFLKEWNKNRFTKLSASLDNQYGYVFKNYNNILDYGYAHLANPKSLRVFLNDNLNLADTEPSTKTHSPIIGFAYDGNPIYGPFGYDNPLDPQSSVVRMTSSYSLNGNRSGGPSTSQYPLGTFVNDYTYSHRSGSLDENNGRFCVTPDFPNGTYAYFLTINSSQVPQFPYVIGENFYSLPVDSNYNSDISQFDIPKASKRLYTPGMPGNGEGVVATISEVQSGTVDSVSVERSSNTFSINSKIYFDNKGTEGSDVEAIVSSVKGKAVNYLQSKEEKVVKLTTIQTAYLFANDTLRQPNSGASGVIVGDIANDNTIVLKNVTGSFNTTGTFSADIKTFSLIIDQDSSYTEGAVLSLTDGLNPPIATAEILEGTNNQNTVTIKVLTGTWVVDDNYFLQSSNLFNTSGSRIVRLTSLSDNLEPFEVNTNVALVETDGNHGLGIGDQVNIDINPDDNTKIKTYYLRKRIYQEVTFRAPRNSSVIDFTGIGRFEILNGGSNYTANTYNNVPLTGGSGTGATASIVVSSEGIVSSVVLQNGGTGYKKGDYLSVDDESLVRSQAALGNARLIIYVDHVGFSTGSSALTLKNAIGFAEGDLLSIGREVVEVTNINGETLTVLRGKEGTDDIDHYNGQEVSLYKPRYNFVDGFQISNSAGSGFIQSYDQETQKAIVVFNYSIQTSTAEAVQLSTTFFDSSTPRRLVSVTRVSTPIYKFEFSEDNANFVPNPNINIQEFYKYVFDTSHSSLTGTFFDLSPSKNYNLKTEEKIVSNILPGNTGSFTEVKFGFGPRLQSNSYQNKVGTDFTNYYYFDKNNVVNSEGSFFKIITDPLQGAKRVTYVTPNRFVYDLQSVPLWDGSGQVTYTTNGQFAIGEINTIDVINLGVNYKKVPVVVGADLTQQYRASATVLFDISTNTITEVRVDNKGSNYVNPKVIITNGDGDNAEFDVIGRSGEIFSITVKNPGTGYTFAPEIAIVESDVESYVNSNTIGVPQSVFITRNGGAFHLDETVSSKFTSKYVVSLVGFTGDFQRGETVIQKINGVEVSRAKVSEWRFGSNLLKIENVTGTIREGIQLEASISGANGTVGSVFVSSFGKQITSFYDNLGYYNSDRGKLGVSNQKILDSNFYQDYSYVVKSKTSIEQWRDLIKSTTHPAGFKLFGQVDVETDASTTMPEATSKANHFTVIQLWDPEKNVITVENTRRTVTQTIQKVENHRIVKGSGSVAPVEFNFNETRAFEFTLAAPFDGTYNSDGQLVGTTQFQVLDERGIPFTPISAESLIITLDGILQEPEVAYNVQDDKIIFSQPPLGPGVKLTGSTGSDVTPYRGVTFYGKSFSFKDSQYNTRYLKKIRNIFQRNGRWLDSANQIERNGTFIVEETIGYGKSKYPNFDWSTKLDDYTRDILSVLEAYEHDLRFGGNVKVHDYSTIFVQNSDYDYIVKNKTQSLDIFNYATNLAKLAIRNWDFVDENVSYVQGSDVITVSNTENLAIGMHVSSGRSYSENTTIVSIDSDTQITVSNNALEDPNGSSATFYFSAINNGTFYDASNLIFANRSYLQEEISEYIYDVYATLNQNDKAKCARDIGFLVDAVTYHLRFGGNQKVVEFAQLYYTNKGYPYGEELTYINRSPEETAAAIDAWNTLRDKMILAMRNSLPAGTYTSITPFVDNTITSDTQSPTCQEVASAISTMIDIVKDIIENGSGAVEVIPQNENKSGFWTPTKTYSNYNIIEDPLLTAQECTDVISTVNILYDNLSDILNKVSVQKSNPDYIDGKNRVFDLYWEDGSEVSTDKDENLFLTINAVLQRPKYDEFYPGGDAYYINREVIPNQVVFDVAPIWDQDFGAKTIGEPTAIEKVSGVGVGNYKRLSIDYSLVNDVKTGPFLILDIEDNTVQNIEDSAYLYVFLDGVLQREGYSYTISGPNIYFTVPIKREMKIDMRYLYGRDFGQILNVYDFAPDTFLTKGTGVLSIASGLNTLLSFAWMGPGRGEPVHAYQINPNGTYNVLGELSEFRTNGNLLTFDVIGNKCEIIQGVDVTFAVKSKYFLNTTVSLNPTGSSITYQTDDDGKALLYDYINGYWTGTFYGRSYRKPFVGLSNKDLIKVEGEDKFRRIKNLPTTTTSKEQRLQEQVSNSMFGTVDIETYGGITRGEGLSVVAIIENGVVVDLEWNQRSFDPLTQPTAYQYYTPPVLHFIPKDGNGGGARANVLVSKGQVISVDLITGGSGYTEAPKVVVARRYDVISDRDIGVSLIRVGVNLYVETAGMTAFSTIDILGNQVSGVNTFTSIFFESPIDTDRVITSQIQLVEQNTELDVVEREFISTSRPNLEDIPVIDLFTQTNQYVSQISGRVADIISNSIITANRQITSTVSNLISNTALSNINYYETGAFLDVNLDIGDNIVYVANTDKFKTNGYLLIGDEVVRYFRKLNDRFLKVQRAQRNTTEKFWTAGTFLRQIPDAVSAAFGGVFAVESESQVFTMKGGAEVGIVEKEAERQIVLPEVSVTNTLISVVTGLQIENNIESISSVSFSRVTTTETPFNVVPSFITVVSGLQIETTLQSIQSQIDLRKEALEFLRIPPPSGAIDGYEESVFISDPVPTRLNGFVNIEDDYGVIQRSGNVIFVVNEIFGQFSEYIGNYEKTNAGPTLGTFSRLPIDDGTANVSGLTIGDISTYYPSLTLRDFVDRAKSSYTLTGDYFNLTNSSIQNPVAISSSSGTIGGPIVVQNTNYFPDSGYLFTSGGTVVQYTSKTLTTFEGCTLYSGADLISNGDEIVPFSIS